MNRSGLCRAWRARCENVWFALLLSNLFSHLLEDYKEESPETILLSPLKHNPKPNTNSHLSYPCLPCLYLAMLLVSRYRSNGEVDDPLVLVAPHEVVNEIPVEERLQNSGHERYGHQLIPFVYPN